VIRLVTVVCSQDKTDEIEGGADALPVICNEVDGDSALLAISCLCFVLVE
jgi:hypothetical protein